MRFPPSLSQRFCLMVAAAALGAAVTAASCPDAQSQTEAKPNPLEQPTSDPLLPAISRPLSPMEHRLLREALVEMDGQAKAEFAAGNQEGAFEIWYRFLRLHQHLSPLEEIEALGKVGAIAWDAMRGADVPIITKRLTLIQKKAERKVPLTPEFLTALATAYGQVHSLDNSLDIYQKVLQNNRQAGDFKAQEETLNVLGGLYLAKFNYAKAAEIYEILLDMAEAQNNAYTQGLYLQELAKIYSQAANPENAVRIKEDLANNYLKTQKLLAIPPIKIAIADDYATLGQAEKASENYQEAFSLAWSLQQFGAAGEALQKLAKLYQDNNQKDYALRIYNELIKVEQESYNYYGLMQTYDSIGQIYLEEKNYQQALTYLKQALTIARTLKYQEDYFSSQIQKVNEQMRQ
jgi:tetratricopeptide (TPR) repeat protein